MIPYQISKDLHESIACVEYSIPNDTIQRCFEIISVNLNCVFKMIAFVLSVLCVILSLKEVVR